MGHLVLLSMMRVLWIVLWSMEVVSNQRGRKICNPRLTIYQKITMISRVMSKIINQIPRPVATLISQLPETMHPPNTFHLPLLRRRSSGPSQEANTPSTRYGKNRNPPRRMEKRSRSVWFIKDTQTSKWIRTVGSPWAMLPAQQRKLLVSTFVT
jgi:hypothetical protein